MQTDFSVKAVNDLELRANGKNTDVTRVHNGTLFLSLHLGKLK